MLESLKEKILSGQGICPDEALWLAEKAGLRPLLDAAQEITVQCAPRRFDLCSIINAKSGRCPEDCKWCAQSAHYRTGAQEYGLVSEAECLRHARVNEASGIGRFSLVTSGRKLSDREVDEVCSRVRFLRGKCGLSFCASENADSASARPSGCSPRTACANYTRPE